MNGIKNRALACFSLALMAGLAAGSLAAVAGCGMRQSANDSRSPGNAKPEIPKAKRPVALPALSASAAVVTIPADEVFYIGNDKVDRVDLASQIGTLLKDKAAAQRIVYVRCAESVKYGSMMPLIEAAFAAGAAHIFFLVENDGPNDEPEANWYLPFERPEKMGTPDLISLLVVEIQPGGGSSPVMTLNKSSLPWDDLTGFLRTLFEFRADRLLYIKPAPDVPYSKVIEIMDQARIGGAEPVILVWKGTIGEEVYPLPLPYKGSSAAPSSKKPATRPGKGGARKHSPQ